MKMEGGSSFSEPVLFRCHPIPIPIFKLAEDPEPSPSPSPSTSSAARINTKRMPLASLSASTSSTRGGDGASENNSSNGGRAMRKERGAWAPSPEQLGEHPLALLAMVPEPAALFAAAAIAGAAAKTVTAPLDRIKLLMQTHGLRATGAAAAAKKAIGFVEAITLIRAEEGIKGYWKGNLPQVIRIIPCSAVQLFAYEVYTKLFRKKDGELSVVGRLAAGACAGMTSTFVTYPLDVLRLRLAVEPGCSTMSQVALNMLREKGMASFYSGLGPSLLDIAPYFAVNFCIFDLQII